MKTTYQIIQIIILFLMLLGCDSGTSSKNQPLKAQEAIKNASSQLLAVRQQSMKTNIMLLSANADSLRDGGGYQSWTPTKMVDHLLKLSNFKESGTHQSMDFEYVTDKATKPWQIVLIPIDEQKIIKVEGYAEDLSKPFITEVIQVPTY